MRPPTLPLIPILLLTTAATPLPITAPTSRPTSGLLCEQWPAPEGGTITDTLSAGAVQGPPASVRAVPTSELVPAPDVPDVVVLAGTVTPPLTGSYQFGVAADDTALLLLSDDASPAHCRPIASVPSYTAPHDYGNYAAQVARPVRLVARHRYHMQVWMQNAAGASHVSVGWRRPDGVRQDVIPGDCLTPAKPAEVRPPSYNVGRVTATLAGDPAPADRPGFHKCVAGAQCVVAGQPVDVSYLLYLPDEFDHAADRRPLFVFLHGNSHQGSDLWGVLDEGPADHVSRDPAVRAAFDMVGLFPQLPDGWRWDSAGAPQVANAIVRAVCHRYAGRIDRRRVYLTGLSMGGKGAWLTALDDPELYADVTTFSAVAVRPATAGRRLRSIPRLHLVCGGDDGDFAAGTRAMYDALRPTFADRVTLTVVPNEGHGVWWRYYGDPAFYRDLMATHR